MSKVKGQLLTCDRCGGAVFLKYISERDTDGGYTKWEEYEKAEGWGYEIGKNLCPTCLEQYKEVMCDFFGEVVKEG